MNKGEFKSPLHEMTRTTPTALWNDSASVQELTYAIEHGAVGATCNPVIVLNVLNKEMHLWKDRIYQLIKEMSGASETLMPIFEEHRGRNGRLSIQTDPRLYRNTEAIVQQALHFSGLAPNMIVKIPVTEAGVTINALAILNEEPNLDRYYRVEVIGGPGAFVLTATDYEDFARAMRIKLLTEIKGPPVARAEGVTRTSAPGRSAPRR